MTQHLDSLIHSTLRSADDAGLIDLRYDVIDGPLGPLTAVVGDAGLVRLQYDTLSPEETLSEYALVSPRIARMPHRLDRVKRELDEYFDGRRHEFELAIDPRVGGFAAEVLAATRAIPYGETRVYGEVAGAAGRPRAYRAAGTALGRNPLPIVIPCHRVVHASTAPMRYTGGVDRKRWLLDLESDGARRATGAAFVE